MINLENEKLENISGGNISVTAPLINALANIINIIKDAGYSLGSGLRRISEDELCPLK